jgi:hypothetical protein
MTGFTVAKTILEQLGGERFVTMTGAKNLTGSDDGLSFQLGDNPRRVAHVRVTLIPNAVYSVTFFPRGKAPEIVSGVYADSLAELFESRTGLYTSLGGRTA